MKYTKQELETIVPIKGTLTINFETACAIKAIVENNCWNVAQSAINSSLTDNFIEFTFNQNTFITVKEGKLLDDLKETNDSMS